VKYTLWIESEEKGPIIGGSETNDNSDVILTFINGEKYVATFFTYDNIQFLRQKNNKTGECLSGKYFWATDLILVEKINREEIELVISHLIKEEEFENVFDKIEDL